MIAVDTQILVYATRADMPWHKAALSSMIKLAESGEPWAIPWACVHEFVGTLTRPKLLDPPSTLRDAFDAVDRWRVSPGLTFVGEGPNHLDTIRTLATSAKIAGARIRDARITAICIENGISELWTADRDLAAFAKLRIRNPLLT